MSQTPQMTEEEIKSTIDMIVDLADNNPQFKEALHITFSSAAPCKDIVETVKSKSPLTFESFVILQRNKCRLKARIFYDNILDTNLFNELCSDRAKMLWYKSIHEVGQLFFYVNHQLENMLNFFCKETNCHSVISSNPKSYTSLPLKNNKNNKTFTVLIVEKFFDSNGKERPLNQIGLWSKIAYWAIFTQKANFVQMNKRNYEDIIALRNVEAHANSSKDKYDLQRLKDWEGVCDEQRFSFVEAILITTRDSLYSQFWKK